MTTSLITQRVFYDEIDISVQMGNYRNNHYDISYTVGEYIHIGTTFPFNHVWIELTKNANHTPDAPIIEVWYNNQWTAVVDIIDGTAGMQQSGRISWATELNSGWQMAEKSETVGLPSTAIYNRYWVRFHWAGHFDSKLEYIGQKFSDDYSLAASYPDLLQPAILEGFKTGKTTWDEQHFMAAEAVVKEIRKRNFVLARGQVFDWTVFEDACCHKVAEIVYNAFGAPYREAMIEARKKYNEELNSRCFAVDSNANGHLDSMEQIEKQGWLTR